MPLLFAESVRTAVSEESEPADFVKTPALSALSGERFRDPSGLGRDATISTADTADPGRLGE